MPVEQAIEATRNKLEDNHLKLWLSVSHICELLTVVLQNSFFNFRGRVYRQVKGLPMGNCISGILSSIFMDVLEQQALRHRTFAIYKRYVDDTLIITTDEKEAKFKLSWI